MKHFLFILMILAFFSVVYAREVSVQIVDVKTPFTAEEKIIAMAGLTDKESNVLNVVLSGGTIDVSQMNAYVSAMNKLQKEKPLSSDETKYLLSGQANEKIKYLSRKKINETP